MVVKHYQLRTARPQKVLHANLPSGLGHAQLTTTLIYPRVTSVGQENAIAKINALLKLGQLLPCAYFMLTFTVPVEFRMFMRSHPRECYKTLFEMAKETLFALAKDPKKFELGSGKFEKQSRSHFELQTSNFKLQTSFTYRLCGTISYKPMRVSAEEFIRRSLQEAPSPIPPPASAPKKVSTITFPRWLSSFGIVGLADDPKCSCKVFACSVRFLASN